MNLKAAKQKLDHVLRIGRVEMYKPIQVAEVLRQSRITNSIDLSDSEAYRVKSRRWRDEVTTRLFNKCSTSSARFQDDLWSPTAVPPSAMVALGNVNSSSGLVETYIYQQIVQKNKDLSDARSILSSLSTVEQVNAVLGAFDDSSLTSSADRLFEILATSVFKTELSQTSYTIAVDRPRGTTSKLAVDRMIDMVSSTPMPLVVDRLGHTNAADGGLDIWTNFGVAVNVKRRLLTVQLLEQVARDTSIGSLHIVCLEIDDSAAKRLKSMLTSGESISVTTMSGLLEAIAVLLSKPSSSKTFRRILLDSFDHEFPLTSTLHKFIDERGYDPALLTGEWRLD